MKLQVQADFGNEEFIPFYQMRLIAGRNFLHSDSLQEFVINETCARQLGFAKPEDALGQFLLYHHKTLPVVGVIADFHETSFHYAIDPLIIGNDPELENSVAVKLVSNGKQIIDRKTDIAAIEKAYKDFYPGEDFNCFFIDDIINGLYDAEQKTSRIVLGAMCTAIFISCLGLFGLAKFTNQKRTKEIGIRKVIGASVVQIYSLLTRDIFILVFISFLIASPISWYFMNHWLQGFAYRITIGWWIFVIAGSGAVLIALLTVTYQALKAALANPVDSLRSN